MFIVLVNIMNWSIGVKLSTLGQNLLYSQNNLLTKYLSMNHLYASYSLPLPSMQKDNLKFDSTIGTDTTS